MDQNPVNRLRGPRRPWRVFIALGTAGIAVVGGLLIGGAVTPDTGRSDPDGIHLVGVASKPTTPQITHKLLLTTHVAKTEVPPPPPPAPENYYNNPTGGPVQCPSGTTPGQVDEYGNESSCQATGGTGGDQPCVEYNDANQCVAWYKP